MKFFVLISVLLISIGALAKTRKQCFYDSGAPFKSSQSFIADISLRQLTVSNDSSNEAWEGTFARWTGNEVNGKDGRYYINFNAHLEEGCTEILVDQNLLAPRGKGRIKFRCRGEGFQDTVYYCKNATR
jgi:hypothetical protein